MYFAPLLCIGVIASDTDEASKEPFCHNIDRVRRGAVVESGTTSSNVESEKVVDSGQVSHCSFLVEVLTLDYLFIGRNSTILVGGEEGRWKAIDTNGIPLLVLLILEPDFVSSTGTARWRRCTTKRVGV